MTQTSGRKLNLQLPVETAAYRLPVDYRKYQNLLFLETARLIRGTLFSKQLAFVLYTLDLKYLHPFL
jgi:hypothetical protein